MSLPQGIPTSLSARFTSRSRHGVARRRADRLANRGLLFVTLIPIVLVLIITVALAVRSWPIFREYSLWDLLSSTTWKPHKGEFGFLPFILGTVWVTGIAVVLAVPACLFTAIYLSEYVRSSTRAVIKPLLDLLAAIPSVVYGVWGTLVIVPLVGNTIRPAFDRWLGFIPIFASNQPTGFSLLSGAIVLAVMIAPFLIAITYEVLATVSEGVRSASLGLGATRWQTVYKVVLPQIIPAIGAGIVLGTSRALGETLAVLMVVGNVPQIPRSIFDAAYPLPSLIANNYGEMMSIPLYDAALLGAAFILLIIILVFNVISTLILQRMLGRNWV